MIKNFLQTKYNQKELNVPNYLFLFMSCYVIWQMGIIWLDANNNIIETATNLNINFVSNLSSLCVSISLLTIIALIMKPNYAYKLCKFASYISLITTIFMLFSHQEEICLYILVASCSVMSLSSLIIYFYTYNSKNIKKQVLIEMLGVGIISLIFHNDIFKIKFIFYNIVSLFLLILFIIGISKISDLEIKFIKPIKKENNKSLYIGIILISIIFCIFSVFGANIAVQIKNGITLFYAGHIIGAFIYYLLNKSKIDNSFIPSIYIGVFILSLGLIFLSGINIYSALLLGIANSFYYTLPYYCNLTYKNTLSNSIYIIYNIIGVLQVAIMDYLLNITSNNIEIIISIYFIISIISICILFIINSELKEKIKKMLIKEKRETLLLNFSNTEKNIVDLILKDYSNKEVASMIYLSQNTIKFHIKNIYSKLNINSRKELISLFK